MTFVTPSGKRMHMGDRDMVRNLLIREDGRVERVCEHGVGHCIGHVREWKGWMSVHGCDGCCDKWETL